MRRAKHFQKNVSKPIHSCFSYKAYRQIISIAEVINTLNTDTPSDASMSMLPVSNAL